MKLIKDSIGKTRGRLIETGNQVQITDASGKQLGRFDKVQNKTFDRSGRQVGPGDQLMSLLED